MPSTSSILYVPPRSREGTDLLSIYQACQMRYGQRKKGKEIAEEMGCSEGWVTQLLEKAEAMGMLQFVIHPPVEEALGRELGDLIRTKLGVRLNAIFVAASQFQSVGGFAARLFERAAKPGSIVVVDGGRTVAEFVASVDARCLGDLTVIPICADPPSYEWSANELATRLAVRCPRPARCLRPPYHETALLAKQMRLVRKEASHLSFVFLGAGPMRRSFTALEFVRHLGLSPTSIQKRYKTVSSLSGYLSFDRGGKFVPIPEIEERMPRAVSLTRLRAAARSKGVWAIVMAESEEKAEAIRSVLSARICNTLIVNDALAKRLREILVNSTKPRRQ